MQTPTPKDSLPELDAMRIGTNYKVPVDIRGFKIHFRPLAMAETLAIACKVSEHISTLPLSNQNPAMEHHFMCRETLKTASCSDIGVFDPKISDVILDRMTVDEVLHLYKQYIAATDKCNPSLEFLNGEQVQILVDEIKKKQHLDLTLIELSFSQLVSLARFFLTRGD